MARVRPLNIFKKSKKVSIQGPGHADWSNLNYLVLKHMSRHLDIFSFLNFLEVDKAKIGRHFPYTDEAFWRKYAKDQKVLVDSDTRRDLGRSCGLEGQGLVINSMFIDGGEEEESSTKGILIKLRQVSLQVQYSQMSYGTGLTTLAKFLLIFGKGWRIIA